MKKLLNKKNNKGFSLVELIVVVLIMGIIAVALAPQVMKWVGTARTNSDNNTAKDIKAAVQIAIADSQGKGETVGATSFVVDSDGVTGISTAQADEILEVLGGDYPTTSAGGTFTCTITAAGQVTVAPTP